MKSVRGFILAYLAVYFVVAIGLNMTLGPPGLSSDYLETYKADQDAYLETIKSDPYKLWLERPQLHPPDAALAAQIAFVQEYEAREAFINEGRRRARYALLFDVFNVFMLLVLVWRFARKPVAKLIDDMVNDTRDRIDSAEDARITATQRKETARGKLDSIDEERSRIELESNQQLAREEKRIAESTREALARLDVELGERRAHEELMAIQKMKEQLVDEAIGLLIREHQSGSTPESESLLIDRFATQLEQMK